MAVDFKIGFIGVGGMAHNHMYAINALRSYYAVVPTIEVLAVASTTAINRENFAKRYNIPLALTAAEIFANKDINTLFIQSPNDLHGEHLQQALHCKHIKNIYIEKPLTVKNKDFTSLKALANKKVNLQVGFQFLQMPAIRWAYQHKDLLGKPIHFNARYLHSSYLNKAYRDKRRNRLVAAPNGGAMVDLGAHALSLLVAFLGDKLTVEAVHSSGEFSDVTTNSDLYSAMFLRDAVSAAVGTVSASRISYGTTDVLELELRGEQGALLFSSLQPDNITIYQNGALQQEVRFCGNQYSETVFPSKYCPSGWLRALVHALYLFFVETDNSLKPSLTHGLAVQRLLNEFSAKI